jgi:uncharacterized protein YhaN
MLIEIEPLVGELAENRRRMAEVLSRLREDEMDRAPRKGEYSPRQVLAHLAGAERGMTRLLHLMAAGDMPKLRPDYDNDLYNARQQEKRAKMSVGDLKAELEDARRDLLALMESLKPGDLGKGGEHPTLHETNVLGVLKQLQAHERAHVQEMSAWASELAHERDRAGGRSS